MKSKLSNLASIAEITASIGVIFSLIFVGFEISDSTREARAATIQSALNSEMNMISVMVDHASTWNDVVTGAPLDGGEEMRRGIMLYNLLMTEAENRFHQYSAGYLDIQSWEGRLASLEPIVSLPMFEIWRTTPGALNHSADFLELLDSLEEAVVSDA